MLTAKTLTTLALLSVVTDRLVLWQEFGYVRSMSIRLFLKLMLVEGGRKDMCDIHTCACSIVNGVEHRIECNEGQVQMIGMIV